MKEGILPNISQKETKCKRIPGYRACDFEVGRRLDNLELKFHVFSISLKIVRSRIQTCED